MGGRVEHPSPAARAHAGRLYPVASGVQPRLWSVARTIGARAAERPHLASGADESRRGDRFRRRRRSVQRDSRSSDQRRCRANGGPLLALGGSARVGRSRQARKCPVTRALLLRGGRILDPSRQMDLAVGDVYVADGKIESLGSRVDVGSRDDVDTLDCAGLIVAPGLIDVHCHLREPGREDVETIATGARAAAAGGFTAVCAMPNTDPVTDNHAAVGFIVRQAARAGAARVYPIGAISVGQEGKVLAEFGEMVGAGAVAVSDDGKPVASAQLMRTALEYARTFKIPGIDHCEEPMLSDGGSMNEGIVSAQLGLKGIPAEAEEIMVIRDILLARLSGGHVHLAHVSTKGSVELIRWGK